MSGVDVKDILELDRGPEKEFITKDALMNSDKKVCISLFHLLVLLQKLKCYQDSCQYMYVNCMIYQEHDIYIELLLECVWIQGISVYPNHDVITSFIEKACSKI